MSTTDSDSDGRVYVAGVLRGYAWSIGDTMKVWSGSSWFDDASGRSFRMALNGTTDPHPGAVKLASAQVGVGIAPVIDDTSVRIRDESWQWKRGDTKHGAFTDIPAEEGRHGAKLRALRGGPGQVAQGNGDLPGRVRTQQDRVRGHRSARPVAARHFQRRSVQRVPIRSAAKGFSSFGPIVYHRKTIRTVTCWRDCASESISTRPWTS